MILNQMIDILWQTAAAVATSTTRSALTFKLKLFEMKITTCNGYALFAENKLYELYKTYVMKIGIYLRRNYVEKYDLIKNLATEIFF